jgi:hypothetical protein
MELFAIGRPIQQVVNAVILIKDGLSAPKIGQSCAQKKLAKPIMAATIQILIAQMVSDYAFRVRIANKLQTYIDTVHIIFV